MHPFRPLYRTFHKKSLNIAFIASGGIGDYLIFFNYIYHVNQTILQNYPACQTTVVFRTKYKLAETLVNHDALDVDVIDYKAYRSKRYVFDLIIDCTLLPRIVYADTQKIKEQFPELYTYVDLCQKHAELLTKKQTNYFYTVKVNEMEQRKFIQRHDIYHYLNLGTHYDYPIPYPANETDYLSQLGLWGKKFITVQTGCDEIYQQHVKLWPIASYAKLVRQINLVFPDIIVVQVGNSGKSILEEDTSLDIINMLNQTTLDQAKMLLKNSLLHIDIEGGLVHLRHALDGGKSIVLFGPTSLKHYSYPQNINIKSDVCDTVCYQMTTCWPATCPKVSSATHYAPCMACISVEQVFNAVQKFLNGQ